MAIELSYPHGPGRLFLPYADVATMNASLGQAAQQVTQSSTFLQRIQSEVIEPTVARSRFSFISPIAELAAELRAACGKAPTDDAGVFLSALDCWTTEAFGWWAQTEQIGRQTLAVGQGLLEGANRAEAAIASRPPPNTSTPEERAFIDTTRRVGLSWQGTGNFLLGAAAEWKPILREVGRLSPVLRDIVIVLQDALDQETLNPDDPRVVKFRRQVEDTITAWKTEIVNRVVDVAFAVRRFALQVGEMNTQVIAAQFNLAAVAPAALSTIQALVEQLASLRKSIDLLSMPGRAIKGLFQLAGESGAALLKPVGEALLDIVLKGVLIVAGVAAVGILGAVVLKKTGVIDTVSFKGAGSRRRRSRHR